MQTRSMKDTLVDKTQDVRSICYTEDAKRHTNSLSNIDRNDESGTAKDVDINQHAGHVASCTNIQEKP